MEKVRFGIIGLGNQGSSYVINLFDRNKIVNGVVSALCDISKKKIDYIKSITVNKDITYFTDYKEMLDSGLCDAVLVEVPHYQHVEIVKECLKRDINVICEKPAGVYVGQVREMNEAAENSKALFAMMFNQRTNCVYRKMRELIAKNKIGELQRVNWIITDWYRTQYYYDAGDWRATWAGEGGGVLINQCPHQLDLIQWIVGQQPQTVRAFCKYGKWHDIEVEDEVTAYLEYKNGATGVFITTTGETPGTNRFEVSGTMGKLLCENDKLWWYKNDADGQEFSKEAKSMFDRPKCKKVRVKTDGENPQHAGIINNFINALLGKEKLFVDGTEGIQGVELMNAIEYSGWHNGAETPLNMDEKVYLAELEKHKAKSRYKCAAGDCVVENTAKTYGEQK